MTRLLFTVLLLVLQKGSAQQAIYNGCKRGNSEYFKLQDGWRALGKRIDGFWYSISDITSIDSSRKTVRVDYVNFQDGDVEEPWVDVRIIVPLATDASAEKFTVCTIKDQIKDTVETILVQYKKSGQGNTFIGGINGREFTCEFDPKYGVKEVEMRHCTRPNECTKTKLPAGMVVKSNSKFCKNSGVSLTASRNVEPSFCDVKCKPGFEPDTETGTGKYICEATGGALVGPGLVCKAVACPQNLNAILKNGACVCAVGFSGVVTPTSSPPYYSSTCTELKCSALGGLPDGIVADGDKGCTSSTILSLASNPTCDVKCDTDLGFAQATGQYTCTSDSTKPKPPPQCQRA